ncbi:MAG: putative minor tail protein [Prokaryotic dsDNA virus sp.]|nr:MAG: putative minor tail protein [Prokaryotic dsDNA virus sp.]|tara:strand:+ start:28104 stop:31901 length:3798 start_codon:yes stop_codon:yes gene_type:complete
MADLKKVIDIKIVGTDQIVQLEQAITQAEQKLKNMTKASKDNAGMQKIHVKNIAKTKTELKMLRAERNAEQKNLIANTNAAKQLDGSYNSLVQRNKDLLTKMKATKGGMSSNTKEMKAMKKEYLANNIELKKFDKTIGNNQRNVGNYGGVLGGAREKLAAVGMAVGAAVVAFQAMSKIVGTATQDFAQFESGFTNVLTLMSGDDINRFGDSMQAGAIDVMKEFGLQADDMNTALFDIVSAGIPAGESIDFMREAANLALGGATDLSTAVDGMTSVMNAFSLETDEAAQVSSAFFSAQKFGKTTVSELSSAIGAIAPIANQAGVSYQELLTSMSLLTKGGIKTDEATTALKATMTALMKPSESAKKKFDELGISYGTNALQSEGLMNILGQVSAAAEENADVLTELIPNVRALTGVGSLGTEQLAEYAEMLKVVNSDYGENSSLAEAVKMQQETLQQRLNVVNAEWSAQKIALGEQLKPILMAVLDIFSSMIQNSHQIVAVVKGMTAGLVAYGAVVAAQNVKQKLFNSAIKAASAAKFLYTKGLSAAIVKVKALNAASKANVFLLIASAIIAIGTAMASWIKQMSAAEKAQASIGEATKQANKETQQEIKSVNEALKVAQDKTKSDKERQEAVDLLNKEVDGFNGTLTLETATTQEAINVVEEHTKAIFNNAKAKALQTKADELALAILDEEIKATDEVVGLNNKMAAGIKAAFSTKTYDQILDEKGNKKKAENIVALQKEQDILEEHIKTLTTTNKKKDEVIKKEEKTNEVRKGTLASLRKEVSDLKKAQDNAIVGSTEFEKITIQLNDAKKKLKDTTDSLKDSTKKELTGFALLKDNVAKAKKALEDKIIAGGNAQKEMDALSAANDKLKQKEDELKLAVAGGVTENDKKIASLKEAITQTENQTKLLQDLGATEDEIHASKIDQINAEIALEIEKMNQSQDYYDTGVENITKLRDQMVTLEEDAAANDWDGKMFGPKVIKAIKTTMAGMDAALGIMNEMSNLADVKAQNVINGLNKERDEEIKKFEESAEFQTMTEEEKAARMDEINLDYDEKVKAIELEQFERGKRMAIAQALIQGAMAIMRIAAEVPKVDFGVTTGILIGAQIVMTGLQVAAIRAQEFAGALGGTIPLLGKAQMAGDIARKYANGGMVYGPPHSQGGVRFNVGGRVMELEGGEAVINKRSTAMYRDQLSAINQAGGGQKFANGGLVMQNQIRRDANEQSRISPDDLRMVAGLVNNQKINVTEAQITGTQQRVAVHEKRARY